MGVSIDSVFSHANWGAKDCNGVSFPLLADFQPRGAMAKALGHFLEDAGITDRSTVIIDKQGIVRFSESATPAGVRDIGALAAECEKINAGSSAGSLATGEGVPAGTKLFVKSSCGPSRKALLAVDNLHLSNKISIHNVTDDSSAAAELKKVGGKDQAPCLVMNGDALYEAPEIAKKLANLVAPV